MTDCFFCSLDDKAQECQIDPARWPFRYAAHALGGVKELPVAQTRGAVNSRAYRARKRTECVAEPVFRELDRGE